MNPVFGARCRFATFAALSLLLAASAVGAITWPQEIERPEGTIVVYQPQPERLEGNILSGRSAMSLELKDREEPIFGAFWFTARIDTDTEAGTALVRDLTVNEVRWPDSTDTGEQRFTQIVETAIPETGFEISLEQLSASLATAEQEIASLDELKHEPPKILFRDELAVLLAYDGTPRFSPVEKSPFERALNAPFVVVRDTRTGKLYLSSGALWYEADDPLGPWSSTGSPPSDLVAMLPEPDRDVPSPKRPPVIVTATGPTELVATDGKPKWTPLPGADLLYVENTETPWLRDVAAGNMYVLLSGRWYRAKDTNGPWTFVRADKLPSAFSQIPPASDLGGVRVSVAGTEEAQDAMLDAQIPQTAAIVRKEAKLEVSYDGKPEFEKIAGTKVSYAVNTGAQVLEIGGRFYAVDDGVWFTSGAATGPWVVADEVPREEIDEIPPSSPVYNTTHVYIYDSTPEVVYVGYTPGYVWSFPYYGVPIYGTGWYYPPYWGGGYYYPRTPTWGLHVGYNPWTGWNYGVSWSSGFFTFGVSWGGGWYGPYRPWGCCGGWYGGGYHRTTVINTGDIHIGNNINVGDRTRIKNRIDREGGFPDKGNLYAKGKNRDRVADRATTLRNRDQARPARDRANDVFADRNGNVARRAGDAWEVRDKGKWQRADAARDRVQERPQASPRGDRDRVSRDRVSRDRASRDWERTSRDRTHQRIDRGGLDRSQRARQHGMSRHSSRPVSRGGTGGGLRRR